MPIREYRCRRCETDFEFLELKADERPDCPDCGESDLERRLSVFSGRPNGETADPCPPPEAGPCGPACCRLPE